MDLTSRTRAAFRWSAAGVALGAAAYAAYAGFTWSRYGRPPRPRPEDRDELLDRFMPVWEVGSRHHVRVSASAARTLAAAREMELGGSPIVRAIFRARELILGTTPDDRPRPKKLLEDVQALGWGVLAEIPDREVVLGAVTQPWKANVVFRALPPGEFAAFHEPDYVKIIWTLRADPVAAEESVFRTETRALATDAEARRKFRPYWSLLSPGMMLIRWALLASLPRAAERLTGERGFERPTFEGRPLG